MFKMKYFVLATLICASTIAGQEKNKKNFVQRHKVLTGIAAGTAAVGGLFAFSMFYLQKDDAKKTLAGKFLAAPGILSSKTQKALGNGFNSVKDKATNFKNKATNFKNSVVSFFASKKAKPSSGTTPVVS